MTAPSRTPALSRLIDALEKLSEKSTRSDVAGALIANVVWLEDVLDFVRESHIGYARERVVRCEKYEVLVMTWLSGQHSVAHDHAGSICAIRVLQGSVRETQFLRAPDGLVDTRASVDLCEGEVVVDANENVHSLLNATAGTRLVTLHVYWPPLPELRRFAARSEATECLPIFRRQKAREAQTVAVIGGGFSGTMTAVQLLREARTKNHALHVQLFEKQAAFGEGAAYRTPDPMHLLNVPATGMSAWPDAPHDFLEWATNKQNGLDGYAFLPRKLYADYLRDTFFREAALATSEVSFEHIAEEVEELSRNGSAWQARTQSGAVYAADAAVIATGHRPPDDPIRKTYVGSHSRYIEDPWATLVLSAIRPNETVTLLGTGLTAVDVVVSLCKRERTTPICAVSRRGLVPHSHADTRVVPQNPEAWLPRLLENPGALSARELLRGVVHAARSTERSGGDWRSVIDGLRPYTSRIWQALPDAEARRFMRLVRPYWEVHRHRTAPEIGRQIATLREQRLLCTMSGRVGSARGSNDGIELDVELRGSGQRIGLHSDWVVNCTGPGASEEQRAAPLVRSLRDAGFFEFDALGLGVRSDAQGRALARGKTCSNLFIVGTLRKADLWESTAVPELREQTKNTALAIGAEFSW